MIKYSFMSDVEQHLQVRAPAPDWFHLAIKQQPESRRVNVKGCPIHYLLWQPLNGVEDPAGLLFLSDFKATLISSKVNLFFIAFGKQSTRHNTKLIFVHIDPV